MLTDIEIARSARIEDIGNVARRLGIGPEYVCAYGKYKAKIDPLCVAGKPRRGRLVIVTAITPTPAGEGKTTTLIGLADAFGRLGRKAVIAMREPSLGPCFGVKGGACGGGYAQVLPMEDINLHFTGDIHAVGTAHNLLAAMLDNHLYQGNALRILPDTITFKRAMDMNDRALRHITVGRGGNTNGVERESGFEITTASEIMALFCLSDDFADLKRRLAGVIVARNDKGEPVTCGDLQASGAMAALLKDAIMPNLVQSMEGTPAFVHGGPFANIAHGCNSLIATETALRLGDWVITEGGFGSDLGLEKFVNIKCRKAGLVPHAAVLVATVRAIKYHGGVGRAELSVPDTGALIKGFDNVRKHIDNVRSFGLEPFVAVNRFPDDTEEELSVLFSLLAEEKVRYALSEVHTKGGEGALELARLLEEHKGPEALRFTYEDSLPVTGKIDRVCRVIYGARRAVFTPEALEQAEQIERDGSSSLPVCIAKTQYSFSDDPKLICRPRDFDVTISRLKICGGAGFIVAYAGKILTMPGLPKEPAANRITVTDAGEIDGLF
ncbi:MAG: formate--tetrahydrofolate ligase [Abditibacteriota bacterium]|nr:formate--tetrahydrofolate ligase [Abditibacteriota bacterium]